MTTKVPAEMLGFTPATSAELALVAVPIGAGLPYFGTTEPGENWKFPHGQALSRTTYATLFARYGTTYGAGDGTTTFNLPDLRGRVPVGRDDMGGTAASRITNAVSGITGTTLGATGGDQRSQQHTHGVNDPGHNHTIQALSNDSPATGVADGSGTPTNTTTATATTGITLADFGAGNSQNVQPSIISNFIIRVL